MSFSEIKGIAEGMGINIFGMKKLDVVKDIQQKKTIFIAMPGNG